MVPNARCGLRREKVAAGGLEEFQHRLVLPHRRVRQVDDYLSAGKCFRQSLTSDGVDAGIGRGGEGLVAALAQNGDGLRAYQAGAADNDDLHMRSPFCSRPQSDECLSSLRIRTTFKAHPSENVANVY